MCVGGVGGWEGGEGGYDVVGEVFPRDGVCTLSSWCGLGVFDMFRLFMLLHTLS